MCCVFVSLCFVCPVVCVVPGVIQMRASVGMMKMVVGLKGRDYEERLEEVVEI